MKKVLVVCTTDSMIWNFLIPHIEFLQSKEVIVECACSRTGFYFEELQSKGLVLHEIPFERSPFKYKNINAFCKLKKLIKINGYDIIQCHEPVGGAMGRLAGKVCGKKVMYFAHGFHFFKGAPKKNFLYYIFENYLSYFTDVLITINSEDYNASLKLHAKSNYLIHGVGIDTSKFIKNPNRIFLKTELGLEIKKFYILSVGELIPRKNHATVIKALSLLPQNVHYIIVGEGEYRGRLTEEIENRDLSDRVHLLGFRKDISSICNAVDVFIIPSYQEGLSVALMEAMAVGLPIVASNIRGNRDLIDSEKGGFLVKTDSPEEYASMIKILLGNPCLHDKYGNYNRKKISLFDTKMVLNEIETIIKNH